MRKLEILGVLLLASAPLYAQDEIARKQTMDKQAMELMARVPFEKSVKGAPYSGAPSSCSIRKGSGLVELADERQREGRAHVLEVGA